MAYWKDALIEGSAILDLMKARTKFLIKISRLQAFDLDQVRATSHAEPSVLDPAGSTVVDLPRRAGSVATSMRYIWSSL